MALTRLVSSNLTLSANLPIVVKHFKSILSDVELDGKLKKSLYEYLSQLQVASNSVESV